MADQDAAEEPAEEEWRFPLSDFEEDGDGEAAAGSEADAADADAAATRETIEAGDPTLEGTFFLLLGMGFALFVISRLVVG